MRVGVAYTRTPIRSRRRRTARDTRVFSAGLCRDYLGGERLFGAYRPQRQLRAVVAAQQHNCPRHGRTTEHKNTDRFTDHYRRQQEHHRTTQPCSPCMPRVYQPSVFLRRERTLWLCSSERPDGNLSIGNSPCRRNEGRRASDPCMEGHFVCESQRKDR